MRTPLHGRSQALLGSSPSNSGGVASISIVRRGRRAGLRIVGRSETPSMVRPDDAFAYDSSVGAKSMFETWPCTVWSRGMPGPRTMNGTRSDSS